MKSTEIYKIRNLADHKELVERAARVLIAAGVVKRDVKHFLMNIKKHDDSKATRDELPAYAAKFVTRDCDPDVWTVTWLHHIHVNPHHWEHWVLPYATNNTVDGCAEIPEICVYEMICDWMSHYKDFDCEDWVKSSIDGMKLHPKTKELIISTMKKLGKWHVQVLSIKEDE